ncbi:MAG: hypothetical protein JWQ81_4497 [Amycolatopsis sp.]|jgi:hypothetical protein|uniref:hypothetical protein n=1 Tax=Amycolatopsis sp. TaxID=37632 RepID=UPI0026350F9C|nr:hypothetical protein [Amycolatopsis sp.]MCU1683758.1 hypothetical protein [Amycolatopsis sp.]
MPDQSYYVHLESLNHFVRELENQIHAMSKPDDSLLTLGDHPLLFGEFGEAGSLADAHRAAVAEMRGLLDQVKGAITFAQDVTTTVADGYEQADQTVAGDLNTSGYDGGSGVIGGVTGAVDGLLTGVGSLLTGGQASPGGTNG